MSIAIQKKAQHIPCGWHSTLRKADTVDKAGTDSYGRKRTLRTGLWRSVDHVQGSLESTWLTGGLAQRIVQSRYCGQRNRTYRTYRTYKTGALGAVCAMCYGNAGVHGCQSAIETCP